MQDNIVTCWRRKLSNKSNCHPETEDGGHLSHQTAPDPNVTSCKPQLKLNDMYVIVPDYNEIAFAATTQAFLSTMHDDIFHLIFWFSGKPASVKCITSCLSLDCISEPHGCFIHPRVDKIKAHCILASGGFIFATCFLKVYELTPRSSKTWVLNGEAGGMRWCQAEYFSWCGLLRLRLYYSSSLLVFEGR